MPEGDTIFRTATTLSKAISGKLVRAFRSQLPEVEAYASRVEGRRIERVEPRGKYLLVHFEEGSALLTHMKMTGSWHIYRPGEPWQKSPRAARVTIATDDFVAVCFAAPVVEMIPRGAVERHPALSRLGPDVLDERFDAGLARSRLRERDTASIAEALLAQSALAGIGNVYKSEVLFLCRIDPFVRVAALSDEMLDTVVAKARELMSRNLEGYARTTTRPRNVGSAGPSGSPRPFFPRSAPRYFVYGRAGEPCLVCKTPVKSSRTFTRHGAAPGQPRDVGPSGPGGGLSPASGGEASRITYFCEKCQPEGATGTLPLPPS